MDKGIKVSISLRPSRYNPSWNETKFLLINNLTDVLNFNVMDYNDHRPDGDMGAATFDLSQLAEDGVKEGCEMKILKDGKERGDLRFDVYMHSSSLVIILISFQVLLSSPRSAKAGGWFRGAHPGYK